MSPSELKIDGTLPNGATILAYAVIGKHGVILANTGRNMTPFVTWTFGNADIRSTASGHYFSSMPEAYEDFINRVAGERFHD